MLARTAPPSRTRTWAQRRPASRTTPVLTANKYRSHEQQVPFSRPISTVLAKNKYRSRGERVGRVSGRGSGQLVVGGLGAYALGHIGKARQVPLEYDRDGPGLTIAVLGHNNVGLTGALVAVVVLGTV